MPTAWDRTAPARATARRRSATAPRCTPTWTPSPRRCAVTWARRCGAIVDGPWKLSAFNADGQHHLRAEQVLLRAGEAVAGAVQGGAVHHRHRRVRRAALGQRRQKITVGYLPTSRRAEEAGERRGRRNPLAGQGYTLDPLYIWGINYFVANFQSTTGNGPIIKQLYFRQALAYLINQAAVIYGPLQGLRHYHRRARWLRAGDPVPVGQGQAGRPVPLQPGQGQDAADQPRLERGRRAARPPAPDPSLCGPGRQGGPAAVVHPAVRHRDGLD